MQVRGRNHSQDQGPRVIALSATQQAPSLALMASIFTIAAIYTYCLLNLLY